MTHYWLDVTMHKICHPGFTCISASSNAQICAVLASSDCRLPSPYTACGRSMSGCNASSEEETRFSIGSFGLRQLT